MSLFSEKWSQWRKAAAELAVARTIRWNPAVPWDQHSTGGHYCAPGELGTRDLGYLEVNCIRAICDFIAPVCADEGSRWPVLGRELVQFSSYWKSCLWVTFMADIEMQPTDLVNRQDSLKPNARGRFSNHIFEFVFKVISTIQRL